MDELSARTHSSVLCPHEIDLKRSEARRLPKL
jgi:hypothetical protein